VEFRGSARVLPVLATAFYILVASTADVRAEPTAVYEVTGDGIAAPIDGRIGDPARGRALVAAHENANCVLCHVFPDRTLPDGGDLGPSLRGIGQRLGVAQLRLRVVDSARVMPATIMPSYYRVAGLVDVAPAFRDRPILSAQDVEDVVAYLATLR
jgi:L-cysteine S-thiosulfotransferase